MPSKTKPITMDAVYTAPGYLFRRMQQIAVAIFVEECKARDLTPVQYASLIAIRTHPGIDATRLSAVIAFDRSTLGSVIERLEAKAYIERSPLPEKADGRFCSKRHRRSAKSAPAFSPAPTRFLPSAISAAGRRRAAWRSISINSA